MESRQNRKLLRYQECRLKRSGLRQFLNNAHEQRPGVHIQTSLFTIIVKDTGYIIPFPEISLSEVYMLHFAL